METFQFANGFSLPLQVMGIDTEGDRCYLQAETTMNLAEAEQALVQAASAGEAALCAEGGEMLRRFRGYTVVEEIALRLSDGKRVLAVALRRPSETEERLTLLEGAVADLGELMGGDA